MSLDIKDICSELEGLMMEDHDDVLTKKTVDEKKQSDRDITIVFAGQVDSGKSTCIGTLVSGELDDGNGRNRAKVSKHKHELDSGQTSDISIRTMTFDEKIITLVDLCGHEKYLKTTNRGIMNSFPDYGMLLFPANRSLRKMKMAKEHLHLLLQLGIPVIVIITKMDLGEKSDFSDYDKSLVVLKKGLSSERFGRTIKFLNGKDDFMLEKECSDLLKSAELTEDEVSKVKSVSKKSTLEENLHKATVVNLSEKDRKTYYEKLKLISNRKEEVNKEVDGLIDIMEASDKIIPVLSISNVTGFHVDTLKRFINHLKPSTKWFKLEAVDDAVIYIDQTYTPKDQGLVISGSVKGKGSVKKDDRIFIGPYGGTFVEFRVWSLRKNDGESTIEIGNTKGTFGIKCVDKIPMERKNIKKGMVALKSKKMFEIITKRFKAEVVLFTNRVTIRDGFNAKLNGLGIDQTVRLNLVKGKALESKGPHLVEMEFLQRPEFVPEDIEFTFREGDITGKGVVKEVVLLKNDPEPDFYEGRKKRRTRIIRQEIKKVTKSRASNINAI